MKKKASGSNAKIIKGAAILAMGAAASKMISFISLPIIARLYGPAEYGVYSVFLSVTTVSIPLLTLCYSIALPLPRTLEKARNLLILSLLIIPVMAVLIALVLMTINKVFELTTWGWQHIIMLMFVMAVTGVYEVLSMWGTRVKCYRDISISSIIQSTTGASVTLVLGVLGAPLGLMVGYLAKYGASSGFYIYKFWGDLKLAYSGARKSEIKATAAEYGSFPKVRIWAQLSLVIAQQTPVLLFAYSYGKEAAGYLGMAVTASMLPILVIGQGISKSFYGEISSLNASKQELYDITITVAKKLLLLSMIPSFVFVFYGEDLFSLVFGEAWRRSGMYFSVLSLYLASQLTMSPLLNLFNVMRKQRAYLIMSLVRALLVPTIFFVGPQFLQMDDRSTLFVYAIFMNLFFIFTFLFIRVQLKDDE